MNSEEPIRASEVQIGTSESTPGELSIQQLESLLLKLSRSRKPAVRVAAESAAIRGMIRRRRLEGEAAERAERERERSEAVGQAVYPSPTPAAIASPTYWPGPGDAFAEVDGCDTEGQRDKWRARVQGPPPWREGVGRGVGLEDVEGYDLDDLEDLDEG